MPEMKEKKIFVEFPNGQVLELTEELVNRLIDDLPVPESLLMAVCEN